MILENSYIHVLEALYMSRLQMIYNDGIVPEGFELTEWDEAIFKELQLYGYAKIIDDYTIITPKGAAAINRDYPLFPAPPLLDPNGISGNMGTNAFTGRLTFVTWLEECRQNEFKLHADTYNVFMQELMKEYLITGVTKSPDIGLGMFNAENIKIHAVVNEAMFLGYMPLYIGNIGYLTASVKLRGLG